MNFFLQCFPRLVATELLFEGEPPRNIDTERRVSDEIAAILAGKECSPKSAAAIRVFPSGSHRFGKQMLAHPELGALLRESPFAALGAVYGNPSLASDLEETIFLNGEAFFEYENWRRETGAELRSTQARYEKALLRDPFWGLRIASSWKDAGAQRRIFESVTENRTKKPDAAAAWLMMTGGDDAKELTEVMHQSPFAAYIGARLFGLRGFTLLPERIERLTPRWACHLALIEPTQVPTLLYERLLDCPAWMVEFQMRSNQWHNPQAAGADVKKSFARMKSQNSPPSTAYLAAAPYMRMAIDWVVALTDYAESGRLVPLIRSGVKMPRPAMAAEP